MFKGLEHHDLVMVHDGIVPTRIGSFVYTSGFGILALGFDFWVQSFSVYVSYTLQSSLLIKFPFKKREKIEEIYYLIKSHLVESLKKKRRKKPQNLDLVLGA